METKLKSSVGQRGNLSATGRDEFNPDSERFASSAGAQRLSAVWGRRPRKIITPRLKTALELSSRARDLARIAPFC
jgi:hypothetical protein